MSQQRVGILGMGAKLPDRVFENDEWTRYVDTSDEWIRTRTGIERRRIASDDETTVSLAVAAARDALTASEVDATDIDEIIVATDTPEVYLPDTASFLQDHLGARNVPSFTLGGSGCAGFIQGLDIAVSRARTAHSRILVVGAELLSRLIDWSDRNICVLFGDAAAAAVVARGDAGAEIVSAASGTDGSQREILKLEVGGTRSPFSLERAERGEHKHLVMNGREVFRQAVARMSEACETALQRAGLGLDDVDLVIPHQANLRIIRAVGRNLGVDDEKVYTNVQDYGNTGSASVPLALWEAERDGHIQPGDHVLLTAFGAGFHWSAAVLRY